MNHIKECIEDKLWDTIKRNFNSENYTNAILDSIQFIGDIIREKSGLDSDGNTLIGSAFGGKNPKIKLNKLKTESEKNIQKGTESILRGIYSAYRNPRSHSNIEDSKQEAFEIIIFINHIYKLIDKSKGKFSTELFLNRVFDNEFVESQKYSDLIFQEVPDTKLFEMAIEIFRQKENGKVRNLQFVWESIFKKLSSEEKRELFDLVSEELRYTDSRKTVIKCIGLFSPEWEQIDEDSRLRAENMLIRMIPLGEKNIFGQVNEPGRYATALTPIIKKSSLRGFIVKNIWNSLKESNRNNQRFIIDYFGYHFKDLEDEHVLSIIDILKKELKAGNLLIYNFIANFHDKEYRSNFEKEIDSFSEVRSDDELPF